MTFHSEFKLNPLGETPTGLPLKLFFTAFDRAHWLDFVAPYGQDRTYNNFKHRFHFPGLKKWIDFLIKDCFSFQTNKASRMDINTAPQLFFAETAEGFNHRISMDTKGPIHHSSKGNSYFSYLWCLQSLCNNKTNTTKRCWNGYCCSFEELDHTFWCTKTCYR